MNLYQCLLTQNDCYKAGQYIRPKGVMVHSTGANNPNLRRYLSPDDGRLGEPSPRHWNQPGTTACVHGFIGKLADGTIAAYQALPWNMKGWHAGQGKLGSANHTHISFEICEDALVDGEYFAAVYQTAVELTALLCKDYDLNPMEPGVVICHGEGAKMGIASEHVDVLHWFPKFGKSMDDFRADVAREMEDSMTQTQFDAMMSDWLTRQGQEKASDWAVAKIEEAKKKGITDGSRPQAPATRQEVMLMVNAIK